MLIDEIEQGKKEYQSNKVFWKKTKAMTENTLINT
jgi:hypothetical protein